MTRHRHRDESQQLPPLEIQPLDVDGVRTIFVGAILWLVAFILLLPFYGQLEESGKLWWLWTCLAGFGLGMYGVDHARRRRDKRRAGDHRP